MGKKRGVWEDEGEGRFQVQCVRRPIDYLSSAQHWARSDTNTHGNTESTQCYMRIIPNINLVNPGPYSLEVKSVVGPTPRAGPPVKPGVNGGLGLCETPKVFRLSLRPPRDVWREMVHAAIWPKGMFYILKDGLRVACMGIELHHNNEWHITLDSPASVSNSGTIMIRHKQSNWQLDAHWELGRVVAADYSKSQSSRRK